jgi:uncharacterized protein (TIGR03086 family)
VRITQAASWGKIVAVTSPSDPVALLERALDQTAEVIASIPADEGGLATPCPAWNVDALVGHLVGQDLRNFLIAARGGTADWQAPAADVDEDWTTAFRTRAGQLLEAWRTADLDQLTDLPGGRQAPLRTRADQQIAELAMHSWDLAKASDQHVDLDAELAEYALAWSHHMLRPEFRGPGKAFGFEIPVATDASAYDRLAGWLGRDPGWTPAD